MLIDYTEISTRIEDTAILQRMGFDHRGRPLAEDGIAGKLTKGASYLDPDVVTTPIAREALKDLLAGAQEEGRPNDGAWVRGYMRKPGVPGARAPHRPGSRGHTVTRCRTREARGASVSRSPGRAPWGRSRTPSSSSLMTC